MLPGDRDNPFMPRSIIKRMPTCPGCGDETTKRMAVIEPSDLREEREYCLTCEKYIDDDAREPADEE